MESTLRTVGLSPTANDVLSRYRALSIERDERAKKRRASGGFYALATVLFSVIHLVVGVSLGVIAATFLGGGAIMVGLYAGATYSTVTLVYGGIKSIRNAHRYKQLKTTINKLRESGEIVSLSSEVMELWHKRLMMTTLSDEFESLGNLNRHPDVAAKLFALDTALANDRKINEGARAQEILDRMTALADEALVPLAEAERMEREGKRLIKDTQVESDVALHNQQVDSLLHRF